MRKTINRRQFIKAAGLGSVLLAAFGCLNAAKGPSNRKAGNKPNIILIMADDIGYECFGCYSGESYKTPVIDELARTGIRFEHCYSQPLCTPSRVKIMTGQYNFRNYVNFGVLDPKQKTFGHLLQGCGYKTCVVGKWQLYGSRGPIKPDPSKPVVLKPMDKNELQPDMQPNVTRDGRPVRTGRGVMPGPADTYIAYGKPWANASNTPFRLYKHWVHEGGISTPLITHWPARIKAHNEFRRQPGHLIDITATCVDVAEAKYPSEYKGNKITPAEGKSLVPASDNKPIQREAIYWEHEGNRAVRQGKWKLVQEIRTDGSCTTWKPTERN